MHQGIDSVGKDWHKEDLQKQTRLIIEQPRLATLLQIGVPRRHTHCLIIGERKLRHGQCVL
jgi:hypothetical protein